MADRFLGSLFVAIVAGLAAAAAAILLGLEWPWVLVAYSIAGGVVLVVVLGVIWVVRALRQRRVHGASAGCAAQGRVSGGR
jgi:membrane protein implicated in regulation of membrane protease activity